VFASIVAFWCGSFVNSLVLAKMKLWTNGRWLWTRIIGSTLCGELVDSALFYTIAFYGLWPTQELLAVTTTQYVLKSSWEIIATPITYQVVGFLKRVEQEDRRAVGRGAQRGLAAPAHQQARACCARLRYARRACSRTSRAVR